MIADEDKESRSRRREFRQKPGDLVFVACLLIGIGVGIAINQVAVAVLIGLGVGFLGLVIVRWKGRNQEKGPGLESKRNLKGR